MLVALLVIAAPASGAHRRHHEPHELPGRFPNTERWLRDSVKDSERDYREFRRRQELEDIKRRLHEIEREKPEERGQR
jgi:hypothetical protein